MSSAREAYLAKYISGAPSGGGGDYDDPDVAPRKKVKSQVKKLTKKNPLTGTAGIAIIDDDIDWRTEATKRDGNKDGGDDKPTIVDMRRPKGRDEDDEQPDEEPTRYIHVERNDGSGWNTVARPSASNGRSGPSVDADGDVDMSASRRRLRHDSPDNSPPRRTNTSTDGARRSRHDSPDNSPPRKRRHDSPDHSPPRRPAATSEAARRPRHDSPDNSPPRRARHDSPDRSPPRRTRVDSPDANPPRKRRHDSPDNSPPRRVRHDSPDNSPPRRVRNDSPDRVREPERKKTRFDTAAASSSIAASSIPAAAVAAPVASTSEPKRGLILSHEFRARNAEAAEKARLDLERIGGLSSQDPAASQTVLRDKSGRKISVEAYEAQRQAEKDAKSSKPMEWSTGLKQKAEAEHRARELQAAAAAPFARTVDDAALNEEQRQQARWGDPSLVAMRKKEKETQAESLKNKQEQQEKLIRKELKKKKKEIHREKKELKHDRKKLLKQLEKDIQLTKMKDEPMVVSTGDGASAFNSALPSKEELERMIDQQLADKYLSLSNKKAALRAEKDAIESKIALDLAAGGSGIVVSATELARASGTIASDVVIREPRPMYTKGAPWPNRYGIKPGYRWDGVERGTGWEDKRIRFELERQNAQTRAYKWGSADM